MIGEWPSRRAGDRRDTGRSRARKSFGLGPLADHCIITRNLSETGACLEIHVPVLHQTFDLVFDHEQSRRSCCVVWRKEPRVGVKFQ